MEMEKFYVAPEVEVLAKKVSSWVAEVMKACNARPLIS